MREELIELLNHEFGKKVSEITADWLIANGVQIPVKCSECRWAKPYERIDGQTGYYCHFCGHSFKYNTNWESLYTPIKEADDYCSYGERPT